MIEEPLHFGEGGRLFGILTLPEARSVATDSPVFIFLSSGLLHRIGPRRMYVRLARQLAELGIRSLRVDLSGKGDSAPSTGHSPQQATARDYTEISIFLDCRLGPVQHVVGGLCSAADDALRITSENEKIIGLLLFDPVCDRDTGFRIRQTWTKYTALSRYVSWLKEKLNSSTVTKGQKGVDTWALRDFPDPEKMRAAFESIRQRNGRVLSVFTSYASSYYNHSGQLGRVLGVAGYREYCTEYYWPAAEHTFTLENHVELLIASVREWAAAYAVHVLDNAAAHPGTPKVTRARADSSADKPAKDLDWARRSSAGMR